MTNGSEHRSWPRNVALLIPLLLVNSAAIYGQSGWAYDHLRRGGWLWAVLFALAIESVGVYLAAEAHAALMAGHSSGLLRLSSYAIGALGGALNYAHFADPGYAPTALALSFGLLSSASPWLWAIRSRSMNRHRLYAEGLIDPRAVRFSRLRWALFPHRTFTAFRLAVWDGVQSPTEAVARADSARALAAPARRWWSRRDTPAPPVAEVEPTSRPLPPVSPTPAAPVVPRLSLAPALSAAAHRPAATRGLGATRDAVLSRHAADPLRTAADIAAELGTSKRTVERHLAAVRQTNGHRVATLGTDLEGSS